MSASRTIRHPRSHWLIAAVFFPLSVFLLLLPPQSFSDQSGSYRKSYVSLRDAVYDQSASMGTVRSLYQRAMEAVARSSLSGWEKHYWLSLLEYLAGRAYYGEGDKKAAAMHYEAGLAHAKGSLRRGDYSEGYRIMSELIGQMCLVKSIGFALGQGHKASKYAERAIELDPTNAKAYIIIASSLIYPPGAFGGRPKKGIERMKEALAMQGIERDDRFNIFSGIGVGYAKLKDRRRASVWLEKALDVYPHNKFAREQHEKLR